MAGILFSAHNYAPINTEAGIYKPMIVIATPANQRVKVLGWEISFGGTSIIATPVQCYLATANSWSVASLTPTEERKLGGYSETVKSTAHRNINDGGLSGITLTDGATFDAALVHPQSGYSVRYPYGQEPVIAGSSYVGLFVYADASVNCIAKLICEE